MELAQWNPNPDHHVLAVGAGKCILIIATGTGGPDAGAITEALLQAASSGPPGGAGASAGKRALNVKWEALVPAAAKGKGRRKAAAAAAEGEGDVGPRVVLRCEREVCCVTWHGKGDYLASVSRGQSRRAVMIHQVSKASTQCPFRK
ncbi:unnamed protein product, partial [Hapterophycus canaliculatus]